MPKVKSKQVACTKQGKAPSAKAPNKLLFFGSQHQSNQVQDVPTMPSALKSGTTQVKSALKSKTGSVEGPLILQQQQQQP